MKSHAEDSSVKNLLMKMARRLLGRPEPSVAIAMHPFDQAHGTDTSGLIERQHLHTGHANDAQNTAYFGVPPSRFQHAIEQWRNAAATLPVADYRFVDLGCGKGRAVLLASRMAFRDVVGVELNPGLAATARSNLNRWQQVETTVSASILCADAPTALVDLLDGATLLYLYNPFQAPVLRQVLEAVVNRSSTLFAPVDVLYLYPEHGSVFEEFTAFERIWHLPIPIANEDEGDGISAATDPCSLYRLMPA